jgi:hypothetical protein
MITNVRIRSPFALRSFAAYSILAMLFVAGCYKEPDRFDQVQKETRRGTPAVSKEAVPGSAFNKLFPKPEGEYDIVYAQEKTGFAQAKLVKKGQDVATLSVFDTVSEPATADKYKEVQEKFQDFPIRDVGENGTAILVGGRYQVQIRSQDANFSKFDREDWLKKFDLANLAKLQ